MGEKPRLPGLSGLRYVGVGATFGACVVVGWYAGRWADQRFGTAPWLGLAGLLLGMTVATIDLIRTSEALEKRDDEAGP